MRYGKIQEAEAKLKELQEQVYQMQGENPMLKEEVNAEDIAESVSGVTHVQNNLRVGQSAGSVGPIGAAASTTTGASG